MTQQQGWSLADLSLKIAHLPVVDIQTNVSTTFHCIQTRQGHQATCPSRDPRAGHSLYPGPLSMKP